MEIIEYNINLQTKCVVPKSVHCDGACMYYI